MAKKPSIQEIESKLDRLKKELKERKKLQDAKLKKLNEDRLIKLGAAMEKHLNSSQPISPEEAEEIFSSIIATNKATMNLIDKLFESRLKK